MAELQRYFDDEKVDVQLVEGDKGIFDVVVDGDLLFSKFKTGEFPRYREIPKLIVARR